MSPPITDSLARTLVRRAARALRSRRRYAQRPDAPSRSRAFRRSTSTPTKASATASSSRSTTTSRVRPRIAGRCSRRCSSPPKAGATTRSSSTLRRAPRHPWRVTAYAGREQQLAAPYYGIGNETPYDAARRDAERRATSIATDAIALARVGRPPTHARHAVVALSHRRRRRRPTNQSHALRQRNDAHPARPRRRHAAQRAHELRARRPHAGTRAIARSARTSGTWADVLVQRVDTTLGAIDELHAMDRRGATLSAARRARHAGESAARCRTSIGDAPFYVARRDADDAEVAGRTRRREHHSRPSQGPLRRARASLVSNNELRWRAADFTSSGGQSSLVLSGFVDAGRVWSDGVDLVDGAQRTARRLRRRVRARVRAELRDRDRRRPLVAVDGADLHRAGIPVLGRRVQRRGR